MGFYFCFFAFNSFFIIEYPLHIYLRSFVCPCAGSVYCHPLVVRRCWLWLIAFNCCCFGACGLFLWGCGYCVRFLFAWLFGAYLPLFRFSLFWGLIPLLFRFILNRVFAGFVLFRLILKSYWITILYLFCRWFVLFFMFY